MKVKGNTMKILVLNKEVCPVIFIPRPVDSWSASDVYMPINISIQENKFENVITPEAVILPVRLPP